MILKLYNYNSQRECGGVAGSRGPGYDGTGGMYTGRFHPHARVMYAGIHPREGLGFAHTFFVCAIAPFHLSERTSERERTELEPTPTHVLRESIKVGILKRGIIRSPYQGGVLV